MCRFKWMGEIGTRRGERFHVYKHRDTRCSVHIDLIGKGLVYDPDAKASMPMPAATVHADRPVLSAPCRVRIGLPPVPHWEARWFEPARALDGRRREQSCYA